MPNWKERLARWKKGLPEKGAWKASLTTRTFRVGGYSVAAAAIVVVIAVVVNLLIRALPA